MKHFEPIDISCLLYTSLCSCPAAEQGMIFLELYLTLYREQLYDTFYVGCPTKEVVIEKQIKGIYVLIALFTISDTKL